MQGSKRWQLLKSKDQILQYQSELQVLAKESALEGAMDFLAYFVSAPYFLIDVPYTSLGILRLLPKSAFTRRARLPRMLIRRSNEKIDAAVFLFEYSLHGLATGCFIPADSDGYRTVIAPVGKRADVASEAAKVLLRKRAVLVLLSYMAPDDGGDQILEKNNPQTSPLTVDSKSSRVDRLLARQVRTLGRKLLLGNTFEATLTGLSRNTRHNLRRSMRQASSQLKANFFSNVDLSLSDLKELAQNSAFGPPEWVLQERLYAVRSLPGGTMAGLRSNDGVWLSIVGGHREGNTLCLDWQLNRANDRAISVATAMRGFLMEYETERETQWMRFENGTTHPMQNAFVPEHSHDLLFARRVLPMFLMRRVASRISNGGPLANVLSSQKLVWRN